MNLDAYRRVDIIVDNRKYKNVLGKVNFKNDILNFLRTEFNQTQFEFYIQPSTTNVLLELADFYSNIFYRMYLNDDYEFIKENSLRYQLKNPLNDLTDVLV